MGSFGGNQEAASVGVESERIVHRCHLSTRHAERKTLRLWINRAKLLPPHIQTPVHFDRFERRTQFCNAKKSANIANKVIAAPNSFS
jgi:hypothetical protein